MGCFFTGDKITIGENTVINRRCYLDGRGGLTIGASVSVSPEVYIISASHDPHDPKFAPVLKEVTIGDRVWIGARAVVLPGIDIGEEAILAAAATAPKSIPPRKIFAGNPAKEIGERRGSFDYQLYYFPWFDTDLG